MTKDFQGIAHDVMTGVGLIRQSSPEAMKGRETVLATASAFRRAFPDMVWTLTGDPVDPGDCGRQSSRRCS